MWQNLSEKGPFFSRPLTDQSEAWRHGTSFGLNTNHETLVHVARQAKEWVPAHALKR